MKKFIFIFIFMPLTMQSQYSESEVKDKMDSIDNEKKQKMILDWENRMKLKIEYAKEKCFFEKNEIDPITNKEQINTMPYSLHDGQTNFSLLNVSIGKYDNKKYLKIYSNNDLGCTVPYKKNRSYAVFKLKDNSKVYFYHSGDVECGDFYIYGLLTEKDIIKLLNSEIEMVRINGTKFYKDIDNIVWKSFFIDMLRCIN